MKTNKAETKAQKEPRASTTDAEARVMKMADGGFRPAYNIQFASLPASGIVVATSCETVGSDRGLAEPMAKTIEATYERRAKVYLVDGGYLWAEDIEAAATAGTAMYCPPLKSKWGRDPYAPRAEDARRRRMARPDGERGRQAHLSAARALRTRPRQTPQSRPRPSAAARQGKSRNLHALVRSRLQHRHRGAAAGSVRNEPSDRALRRGPGVSPATRKSRFAARRRTRQKQVFLPPRLTARKNHSLSVRKGRWAKLRVG